MFLTYDFLALRLSHCEKSGVPNLIRPEACGRHDRETVTQVDGQ